MIKTVKSPVAFFIYNRPRLTERTFAAIRAYQPEILFIFSDGPKENTADQVNVVASRKICEEVDWPCNVIRFQSTRNQGCRESITQGLAKIFAQVQECIILEDDCLPDPTFFIYCSTLLEQYRDNNRVMSIGGHKPAQINTISENSYFYSKYPSSWGWATWRRAYLGFDPSLKSWSVDRNYRWLSNYLGSDASARYWSYMFEQGQRGKDYWDYAWAYHCWRQNGLAIRAAKNLIFNIGFGTDATITTDPTHPFALNSAEAMPFPMHHPETVGLCNRIDTEIEDLLYSGMRRRQLSIFHKRIKQSPVNPR